MQRRIDRLSGTSVISVVTVDGASGCGTPRSSIPVRLFGLTGFFLVTKSISLPKVQQVTGKLEKCLLFAQNAYFFGSFRQFAYASANDRQVKYCAGKRGDLVFPRILLHVPVSLFHRHRAANDAEGASPGESSDFVFFRPGFRHGFEQFN